MPTAAMRPCLEPRCPTLVMSGRCEAHRRPDVRQDPEVRKWYKRAQWLRLRASILAESPLCVDCFGRGRYEPATDVDHIEPHRGVWEQFINRENLQPLCHRCHSRKTRAGL